MTATDFQPIIDWLSIHPHWVLLSIALIAFIESLALAGIIVPGVLLLFLVAVLAGNLTLPLWEVLTAGFIGAASGDILSFYIGRLFKQSIREYWPFSRYPKAFSMGEDFFKRHGGKSVIIGRFIGPIRPILPLIAGMLGMSQLRFISFNLFSALAWSPFYLLPGYLAGTATQTSLKPALPEHFYLVLTTFIIVILVTAFVFRYLSLFLQQSSPFYAAMERKKQTSVLARHIWVFLTRYQKVPREFPLASFTLLIISSLFFWTWTLLTLQTELLLGLDQFMLNFALDARAHYVDHVLVSLTLFGDERFLYYSFAIFVAVLISQGRPMAAIHLVIAGLSTAAITHGLKYGFSVPRPDIVTNAPSSLSYPSGHSSGAAVFYGLVASFIAQEQAQKSRWKTYLILGLPIMIIALSRALLGVHWLSDIVGGVLLGLALCAITRVVYSRYEKIEQQKAQLNAYHNKIKVLIGSFVWCMVSALYQYANFSQTLSKFQLISS